MSNLKDKSFPHNRIIFGAPGTGKSYVLEEQSKNIFKISSPINYREQLQAEIDSKPNEKNQGEWFTAIGFKYSTYIFETYINGPKKQNDLITDFNLITNGNPTTKKLEQLIQGAQAARCLNFDLLNKKNNSNIERVTFHPSYSYANFVGTYKPVKDEKGNGQITYEFVEGPFIRILQQALKDPANNYLLIIEEINRANVAAVFGDVFQLLDRNSDNESVYEVAASEDLRKHLLKNGVSADKATVLRIPSNMYIWATMNSADQGVQPLDTAFKRRWEFEYLGINDGEKSETFTDFSIPNTDYSWNVLRHLINNRLSSSYNINEDKLLGPFFIKKGNQTDEEFIKSFKSKVLMYLFEDVCKINPKPLFAGIKDEGKIHFSKIVEEFDNNGIGIFGFTSSEIDTVEKEIQKNKTKTEEANAERT